MLNLAQILGMPFLTQPPIYPATGFLSLPGFDLMHMRQKVLTSTKMIRTSRQNAESRRQWVALWSSDS